MGSAGEVLVVGSGIAGVSAAVALRAAGVTGRVRVVGEEQHLPYRRPAVSKELVRGEKAPEQLLVRPARWYADKEVELLLGARAVGLDPAAHTVDLADGTVLRYDRLVLATGGRARTLPGLAPSPRVRTLRTAQDALDLVTHLEGVTDVVVVGAGLVGSEIAASLRALDREVTVLEGAPHPLARILPAVLASRYAGLHKERGVQLETDVTVASVTEAADRVVVTAADGRSWSAGLVVVAIGIAPDLDLADSAGLATTRGGIAVDWCGRTSVADVYAAGDVVTRPTAHLEGPYRGEHWQSAQDHGTAVGRTVAADLLGDEAAPYDEVPWAWSDQYEVNLQVTGWPEAGLEMVLRGDPHGQAWAAFFLREGRMRGAVACGRPLDVRGARQLVADRSPVDRTRLADPGVPVLESVL